MSNDCSIKKEDFQVSIALLPFATPCFVLLPEPGLLFCDTTLKLRTYAHPSYENWVNVNTGHGRSF